MSFTPHPSHHQHHHLFPLRSLSSSSFASSSASSSSSSSSSSASSAASALFGFFFPSLSSSTNMQELRRSSRSCDVGRDVRCLAKSSKTLETAEVKSVDSVEAKTLTKLKGRPRRRGDRADAKTAESLEIEELSDIQTISRTRLTCSTNSSNNSNISSRTRMTIHRSSSNNNRNNSSNTYNNNNSSDAPNTSINQTSGVSVREEEEGTAQNEEENTEKDVLEKRRGKHKIQRRRRRGLILKTAGNSNRKTTEIAEGNSTGRKKNIIIRSPPSKFSTAQGPLRLKQMHDFLRSTQMSGTSTDFFLAYHRPLSGSQVVSSPDDQESEGGECEEAHVCQQKIVTERSAQEEEKGVESSSFSSQTNNDTSAFPLPSFALKSSTPPTQEDSQEDCWQFVNNMTSSSSTSSIYSPSSSSFSSVSSTLAEGFDTSIRVGGRCPDRHAFYNFASPYPLTDSFRSLTLHSPWDAAAAAAATSPPSVDVWNDWQLSASHLSFLTELQTGLTPPRPSPTVSSPRSSAIRSNSRTLTKQISSSSLVEDSAEKLKHSSSLRSSVSDMKLKQTVERTTKILSRRKKGKEFCGKREDAWNDDDKEEESEEQDDDDDLNLTFPQPDDDDDDQWDDCDVSGRRRRPESFSSFESSQAVRSLLGALEYSSSSAASLDFLRCRYVYQHKKKQKEIMRRKTAAFLKAKNCADTAPPTDITTSTSTTKTSCTSGAPAAAASAAIVVSACKKSTKLATRPLRSSSPSSKVMGSRWSTRLHANQLREFSGKAEDGDTEEGGEVRETTKSLQKRSCHDTTITNNHDDGDEGDQSLCFAVGVPGTINELTTTIKQKETATMKTSSCLFSRGYGKGKGEIVRRAVAAVVFEKLKPKPATTSRTRKTKEEKRHPEKTTPIWTSKEVQKALMYLERKKLQDDFRNSEAPNYLENFEICKSEDEWSNCCFDSNDEEEYYNVGN